MRWLNRYVEYASRTFTVNFTLSVMVWWSVCLGLAIARTTLALHHKDAFNLVFGLINILISALNVSLFTLVLRRQHPPALRHH